jgi:hypothetical protein
MAINAAAFERIGVRVSADELEQLIAAAIEDLVPLRQVMSPMRELTAEESAALQRAGMRLESHDLGANDPIVRATVEYAAILASALTVGQAAERLGIHPSRLRHRLADRTIYGIRIPSGWRIPAFQFEGDRMIPGLEQVLPRLDRGVHPLSAYRWLTLPDPGLHLDEDETPVSPIDWLRAGGDPTTVTNLLEYAFAVA